MPVKLLTRPQELSLTEVLDKYPDFPPLVALKIDVQRRGVHYTEAAQAAVNPAIHQLRSPYIFGSRDGKILDLPESLLLRDGTTILTDPTPLEQDPYTVDYIDGRFALVDHDSVLEYVDLWPKPLYYDKYTTSGVPMKHIISARPQRLNVMQNSYCHFWADDKGCRFCDIVNHNKQQKEEKGVPVKLNPQDVSETVREALKEKGRFTSFCLTAGSILKGKELFDLEVDYYVETLKAIGENFSTKKFPSQLIGSAFNLRQLERLYNETGLTSYTSDIEVFGECVFNWVCPGKAKWVGYEEWKRRLVDAVDIFGRGNVGTGLVAGAELVQPGGYKSEDEALDITLSEAEALAQKGVTTVYIVWVPRPLSVFKDEQNASLEYYVRLAQGLHDIRKKNGLSVDFDDYRRCGNHPDTDLARTI